SLSVEKRAKSSTKTQEGETRSLWVWEKNREKTLYRLKKKKSEKLTKIRSSEEPSVWELRQDDRKIGVFFIFHLSKI
ncbi:MAG: hypothetical protein ACTHOO_04435, partial [Alcanivorax sp.]